MRNVANKVIGSKFYHEDCNSMASEEENLVLTSGQSLIEADNYQLSKAVSIYTAVGNFYTDSGTANHYILSAVASRQFPISYLDGMSIRFRTSHTNTGISDVNVAGLGIKTIKKEDGVFDLGAGDITANVVNELIYNASTGYFELYSHKYEDQVFHTGMVVFICGIIDLPGWLTYFYDGTIGSASSGASFRANPDCQELFVYLWNTYSNSVCPVDGGRLGTAILDWNANKRIHVPAFYNTAFAARSTTYAYGTIIGQATQSLSSANNGPHFHNSDIPNTLHGTNEGVHGDDGTAQKNPVTDTFSSSSSGLAAPFSILQPTSYWTVLLKL